MNSDDIGALVRHLLGGVGASLVTAGYLSNDQATAIIGGIGALAAVGWSLLQKRKQRAAVAAASTQGAK